MNDQSPQQTPAAYLQQLAEGKGVPIEDVAQAAGLHWDDLQRLRKDTGFYGTLKMSPIYQVLQMSFDERRTFDQLAYAHWPHRVLPYQDTNPEDVSMTKARGQQLLHMIERRGIGMDKVQEILGINDPDPLAPPGRLARDRLNGLDGGVSEAQTQIIYQFIQDVASIDDTERNAFLNEQSHISELWHHHALESETIPDFMRAKFTQRGISQAAIAERLERTSDHMAHAMGGKKPFPYKWVNDFDHILYFEPDEWQHLQDLYERNHGYSSAFMMNLVYAESHQGLPLRPDMPLPEGELSKQAKGLINSLGWDHLLDETINKPAAAKPAPAKANGAGFRDDANHTISKPKRPERVVVDEQMGLMETLQAVGITLHELTEHINPRAMSEGLDRGFSPKALKRVLEQEMLQPPHIVEAVLAANERHREAAQRAGGAGSVGS
ncbi:MAG: hypothetical protein MRY32_04375 [Rickettsiales bacterium]|nr:hypothetical protein [Rickettsiales bacterium]